MAAGRDQQPQAITQSSYSATPYRDSSWEVVGEDERHDEFAPMEVAVLTHEQAAIDPMFADFGGCLTVEGERRWHLPEHLAWRSREEKAELEAEEGRLTFAAEELERMQAEAREQGKRQALEEMTTRQQERLERIEKHLIETLNDLARQLKEHQAQIEHKAVELAIGISQKIIDGAVEINPEYIIAIVREALKLAGSASVHKVRLSPQDMEFIELVGISRHLKEYDGSWQFEADSSVKAGCIVETSAGEIDYQLDSAWERIRDKVLKVVR